MNKAISRSWILMTFCLVLALVLSAITPQAVAAQEPPSRPDIPRHPGPHPGPHPSPSSNGGSGDSATGRIVLYTQPDAWTVVQWQDGSGQWHDVEGWRGQASGGRIAWKVEEKDFGTGPFRWVAYQPQTEKIIGTSHLFYLPGAGETIRLEIQSGWCRAPVSDRSPGDYCLDRRHVR